MARRFRFLSLPEDQRNKISNFLSQYVSTSEDPNLHNKVLDAIEKTGNIPDEYLAGITGGRASVNREIGSILSALPTHKKAREDYIASQKDEAGLTDDELQDRIDAYQNLDENSQTGINREKLVSDLADDLVANGYTNYAAAKKAAEYHVDYIIQGRTRLNETGAGSDAKFQYMESSPLGQAVVRALERFKSGQYATQPIKNTDSIIRIQDILNSRMSESQKQAALDQFLAETPEALRRDREDYLASQEELAGSYLKERAIPNILRDLNMRGTIDSPGEFASALSVEAGGLQGRIEETARTLEQQDNIFFADAAYRLQLSKLEASEQDYRAKIAAERTRVRQDQGQGFASREGQLARDFEADILRREQDRALNLRSSELSFDSSKTASNIRTSLLSDTASSTANLIGNKLIYGGRKEKEQTPSEKSSGAPALTVKPVPKAIG